jgi:hypothetical protein
MIRGLPDQFSGRLKPRYFLQKCDATTAPSETKAKYGTVTIH